MQFFKNKIGKISFGRHKSKVKPVPTAFGPVVTAVSPMVHKNGKFIITDGFINKKFPINDEEIKRLLHGLILSKKTYVYENYYLKFFAIMLQGIVDYFNDQRDRTDMEYLYKYAVKAIIKVWKNIDVFNAGDRERRELEELFENISKYCNNDGDYTHINELRRLISEFSAKCYEIADYYIVRELGLRLGKQDTELRSAHNIAEFHKVQTQVDNAFKHLLVHRIFRDDSESKIDDEDLQNRASIQDLSIILEDFAEKTILFDETKEAEYETTYDEMCIRIKDIGGKHKLRTKRTKTHKNNKKRRKTFKINIKSKKTSRKYKKIKKNKTKQSQKRKK